MTRGSDKTHGKSVCILQTLFFSTTDDLVRLAHLLAV